MIVRQKTIGTSEISLSLNDTTKIGVSANSFPPPLVFKHPKKATGPPHPFLLEEEEIEVFLQFGVVSDREHRNCRTGAFFSPNVLETAEMLKMLLPLLDIKNKMLETAEKLKKIKNVKCFLNHGGFQTWRRQNAHLLTSLQFQAFFPPKMLQTAEMIKMLIPLLHVKKKCSKLQTS